MTVSSQGLNVSRSSFSATVTVDRLKASLAEAGLILFCHIDQAAAARGAGLSLAPFDLLLFGDPRAGTALMASHPTVGLDLPLKAIVWQDAEGVAWLAFNDPAWIAKRHGLGDASSGTIAAMTRLQAKLTARTVES